VSARAPAGGAKVGVSGSGAIGVKHQARTGYVAPAPFVPKKSIKPLTSVRAFAFKTDTRATAASSKDENTNLVQSAAAQEAVAHVADVAHNTARPTSAHPGNVTPKRNVKDAVGSASKGSAKRLCDAKARTSTKRSTSVMAARLQAAFPHDVAAAR